MSATKSNQFTVRVTDDMWLLMEQIIRKEGHRSINEFVRTCIRAYLDQSGDVIGSRRHFSRQMNARMDRLEALIEWNSLQTQVLSASGMFTILDELAPDAEQEPPTPDKQMTYANQAGRRLLPQFLEEQGKVVAELEKHHQQKKRRRQS